MEIMIGMSLGLVTFIHCLKLGKQIREKKKMEIGQEILDLSTNNEEQIERLRKIYYLPRETIDGLKR
jgi:hypothetical protein